MRMKHLLTLMAAVFPAAGQEFYPRHNFTFNIGAATPTGEIRSFMGHAPQIGFGYGYRFNRYLQADAGLDLAFGAASVKQFVSTDFGTATIRDREYGFPFGGRAIAPLADGRLLLSAGGGGIWLRYSEHLSQPGAYYGYSVSCGDTCTSRSGWGAYGLLAGSYFLDSDRHFRIGVTSRLIRAHTNGEPIGNVPGTRTSDHWVNVAAELGFSF